MRIITKIQKLPKFILLASWLILVSSPISAQNNLNPYKEIGITSLMQSVANNDIEGVKFFLKINSLSIDKQNIGGATALHIAVRNNNLEIVNLLLRYNAEPNIKDNEGYTPLMRAILYSNHEITESLLKRNARVAELNLNSESPIIISAISSCNQCLKLVLNKIIPGRNFSTIELKSQIRQAFIIANWKDNQIQKIELNNFYDKFIRKYKPNPYPINKIKPQTFQKKEAKNITEYELISNKPSSPKKIRYETNYILKKGKEGYSRSKKYKRYRLKKGKRNKIKYKFKSSKKPKPIIDQSDSSNITIEPNPVGRNKSVTLDGKNVITRDLDDNIEMKNAEIRKTFIIK